jgi:hypothetical protein
LAFSVAEFNSGFPSKGGGGASPCKFPIGFRRIVLRGGGVWTGFWENSKVACPGKDFSGKNIPVPSGHPAGGVEIAKVSALCCPNFLGSKFLQNSGVDLSFGGSGCFSFVAFSWENFSDMNDCDFWVKEGDVPKFGVSAKRGRKVFPDFLEKAPEKGISPIPWSSEMA